MTWAEYRNHGKWYLQAEYIDPPSLMREPLVSVYDCGRMTVDESKSGENGEFIVKPTFQMARYSASEETKQYWKGNATLTDDGSLNAPDLPMFGPLNVTIGFKLIALDENSDVILHVCGQTPLPIEGLPTFQAPFL